MSATQACLDYISPLALCKAETAWLTTSKTLHMMLSEGIWLVVREPRLHAHLRG